MSQSWSTNCGVLLAVLLLPSAALADRLALSASATSVECELQVSPGFYQIHMIHIGTTPRLAVTFRALTPPCWADGVWLGDIVPAPFLKQESTHGVGIGINYRSCDTQPTYLGYMNFYAPTAVTSCCSYEITPHQNSSTGTVEVINCDLTVHVASLSSLTLNPDASCSCAGPVPVRETTWGSIKALYR